MCIITRDLGPVFGRCRSNWPPQRYSKADVSSTKSIYQSKLRAQLRTNCVIEFKLMVSVFAK